MNGRDKLDNGLTDLRTGQWPDGLDNNDLMDWKKTSWTGQWPYGLDNGLTDWKMALWTYGLDNGLKDWTYEISYYYTLGLLLDFPPN